MLKLRVITALVLVALLLPTLWVSASWPFMLFMGVAMTAAGWEWGRLNGLDGSASLGMGAVVALIVGALAVTGTALLQSRELWVAVGALWVAAGAFALRAGPDGWRQLPRVPRLVLGVLVLVVAWGAMVRAHQVGLVFLLSVFCLVWMADIAAYFGGRALGRRKLAPSISPGKSWEGAWSGWIGVVLLAIGWILLEHPSANGGASLFSRLWSAGGVAGLLGGLVLLVGMSIVGDLFESLVKRSAGAKDSSALLPGHGGVLDRIDALLPVFPLAVALAAY